MNKMKLFSALAASAFAFSTFVSGAAAEGLMSGNTDAGIIFEEDNNTVVIPTDPDKPGTEHPDVVWPGGERPDPGKPGEELPTDPEYPNVITPGPKAGLWLAERPKEFDFGTNQISAADIFGGAAIKVYPQVGTSTFKQAVSVYDGRLNADDWHVTAQLGAFDSGKLVGSTITVKALTNASLTNEYNAGSTAFGSGVVSNVFTISQGSAATLFQATGKAKGTNAVVFGEFADVEIHIPREQLATGAHNAEVTWTLSATPGA